MELRYVALLVAALSAPAIAEVPLDSALPAYAPRSGVSGTIKSVGSDTMNNLMTLWGEGFLNQYPGVQIEVEGKGSSTAPPALISGSATFGPMSRPMKPSEIDAFEKKFGYRPTELRVAIDMLAVYVHKDNPIRGLSLQQVDAIFSKARKGGHPSDLRTWGDVGLLGAWAQRPIICYGRNAASGTYGYFKEHALFKGDFKDSVKEQPGSSAVISSVARDLGGIGYSGMGYRTADVRMVPLSFQNGEEAVAAIPENAYRGTYPLARFLLLTVNHRPRSTLDPLRAEFVRFVFSRQGQAIAVKDGYLPVPAAVALAERRRVGLGE